MKSTRSLIPKVEHFVSDARIAWKVLNGVFAVYKPSGVTFLNTRDSIIHRLCEDLNSMHVRPPIQHVRIEGDTTKKMKVVTQSSYADHPLVVGPRYQPKDFKLSAANYLMTDSSGLLICGINNGTKWIQKLIDSKPPISYKVKGILGQATDNYFKTGKIVEKSTYKYIKRSAVDKICASMQAAHQRKMFEFCGLDMQSQAAYELAVQGLVRPADNNIPIVYTIKCVDFKSPEFTLDLALLRKHWGLQNILDNIEQCHNILDQNRCLLKQNNPILVKQDN
ncbi:putative trna pseudouridine synthase 2-like protein [Lasius niger]|uniref:Putative trna pseudouridine synthase 2-like protein n=1 Tax=Lasius niger TaxID=67767 RepID=A0A0J7KXG1_LASNI|nr:putative trna pseudouridine synthase 2-like protein [Lasius niger]